MIRTTICFYANYLQRPLSFPTSPTRPTSSAYLYSYHFHHRHRHRHRYYRHQPRLHPHHFHPHSSYQHINLNRISRCLPQPNPPPHCTPTTLHSPDPRSHHRHHSLHPPSHPMHSSHPTVDPFSTFFTNYFLAENPSIATHLRPAQTAQAAAVYLFRFSSRLSKSFVSDTLASITRSIADVSGKSLPESRRLFTSAARKASRLYFANGWENITAFVVANDPVLLDLQKRNTKLQQILSKLQQHQAPEVDSILLHALLDRGEPVCVFVFADYCSVCKEMKPNFEAVAKANVSNVRFVTVNGPLSPQIKATYELASYPAILKFHGTDLATTFPSGKRMTEDAITAFAKGDTLLQSAEDVSDVESDDLFMDSTDASPRRLRTMRWANMLRKQGIDEWDVLANERNQVLSSKIQNAIYCASGSSCQTHPPVTRKVENGEVPPLCVMLGGGMGAGKTTAVNLIAATGFWRQYGDGVVVVEADEFKMNDPLFQVLNSVTPLASRIVHHDSMVAAEELFVKAVNSRRDIVFDGTLSWSEYARQTVRMLRDTEYLYKRGPGYQKGEDGEVTEIYWERAGKRVIPVEPYHVELVGVTADAEIAVMRGIVRKITDGRAVPIPDQLHSHALFSGNFEEYVDMVDAVYLFDTTLGSTATDEKPDYGDHLIAVRPGILFDVPENTSTSSVEEQHHSDVERAFVVRDVHAYERFLKKKELNVMASGTSELFPDSVGDVHHDV